MWIFLNNAFLSIVTPAGHDDHNLMVRARVKGDIQRVFPRARVVEAPKADYRFRASISRDTVATAIAKFVIYELDYPNFKNSIPKDKDGDKRHSAYTEVWNVMAKAFGCGLYNRPNRREKNGSSS